MGGGWRIGNIHAALCHAIRAAEGKTPQAVHGPPSADRRTPPGADSGRGAILLRRCGIVTGRGIGADCWPPAGAVERGARGADRERPAWAPDVGQAVATVGLGGGGPGPGLSGAGASEVSRETVTVTIEWLKRMGEIPDDAGWTRRR